VTRGIDRWTAHPSPPSTLSEAADHRSHPQGGGHRSHQARQHFDGITAVSLGLEGISTYPALIAELLRRGYKDDEVRRFSGRTSCV
jgi:membrane dipeptidase